MSNTNKEKFGPFSVIWPVGNLGAEKETDSAQEIIDDFKNYAEPLQCYKFFIDMFAAYVMHYDTVSSDDMHCFITMNDLIFKCEQHNVDRRKAWAIGEFMEYVLDKDQAEVSAVKKIMEAMTEKYGSLSNGINQFKKALGK